MVRIVELERLIGGNFQPNPFGSNGRADRMRRLSHVHLKGRIYSRTRRNLHEDRWTVREVYFDTNRHEAQALLISHEGEEVEVPVSHLRDPFWHVAL